jgi:hypothetical protein
MRRSTTNIDNKRNGSGADSQISGGALGMSSENPFGTYISNSKNNGNMRHHIHSLDQESDACGKLGHVIGDQSNNNLD